MAIKLTNNGPRDKEKNPLLDGNLLLSIEWGRLQQTDGEKWMLLRSIISLNESQFEGINDNLDLGSWPSTRACHGDLGNLFEFSGSRAQGWPLVAERLNPFASITQSWARAGRTKEAGRLPLRSLRPDLIQHNLI